MKFLIIIPGIVLIGLLIYLFFHSLYLIIGGTKARSKYMKKQLENSKNLIEENIVNHVENYNKIIFIREG